ncbi:MAG: hypothetical protein ACE1Y2_00200 [Stenotrophomonas maltophilia]
MAAGETSNSQTPPLPGKLSPEEFARDILRVDLWHKQAEVLSALPDNQRVAVKSGNGLGKGFCASVAVLWFLYTHDPAIVLSTAPTFRQVQHVLWRQIRQLHRRAKDTLKGKLISTRWDLAEDRYAMGLSADTADEFQGFHSPNMFIVVDEAEGVSDEIYEAIEGVMTSAECRLLLIGNPTTVTGVFRRAFHEESHLYYNVTISALDSPNVTAGKVEVPGLTTARWVNERKEIWGEDNPLYRARVLGEFPDLAEDALIRLSEIEAAGKREQPSSSADPAADQSKSASPDAAATRGSNEELPPSVDAAQFGFGSPRDANADPVNGEEVVLAVDVARFGSDRSVILRRRGQRVEEIRTFQKLDTMQLTGWVAAAIQEFQPDRVCIDEIGVGAGVVDRLREQGYQVKGINVARWARQDKLFANLRAEGYWRLRELFATGTISIPTDSRLMGELAALRYSYDSQGRIIMESKEAMRQRGQASPDVADALMLAFVDPPSRARLWT